MISFDRKEGKRKEEKKFVSYMDDFSLASSFITVNGSGNLNA